MYVDVTGVKIVFQQACTYDINGLVNVYNSVYTNNPSNGLTQMCARGILYALKNGEKCALKAQ